MFWWIRWWCWQEYHRYCHTAYNSYSGHMICIDDGKQFRYDDHPAAR